jgi:ribitol-5-phosphate 2-dehydrogenase (NADP+) / D-ribitol-5-phosphate cytidylyltransferase
MRIHALLLAGGDGNRFGADIPKQFVRLAGEPILVRSARGVAAAGVDRLVVVAHPSWLAETEATLAAAHLPIATTVVAGGATRNESTRAGLAALDAAPDDIVVVHDAVRPLIPVEVVRRSIEPILAGLADATDTVIPSADTLVIVEDGRVAEIPDRARYRRGQTPQTFRASVLAQAYAAAAAAGDLSATDDCSLVLRYVPGVRLAAVAGDEVNLKITTRIDMVMADRMLQMRLLEADAAALAPAARSMTRARILVVGGTNGIGAAIASEATRQGAAVEVDGRSLGLDVRDGSAVGARVDAASDRLGGLDHVVCTAGILRIGSVAEGDGADLAEVIDVNVTGTLNVARAAHRHLCRSRGSFTAFASSSFTVGRPRYVAYSASKAAVVNIVQGLAEEWGEQGIRVNAVSPERTDTPMRRRAFPDESREGLLGPEEVAVATLRLLTTDLTGQVLDVRRHDPAGG